MDSLASATVTYDLFSNIMRNSTTAGCLVEYSSGNAICMDRYLGSYRSAYGVGPISIAIESGGTEMNLSGAIRCFPYRLNGSLVTVCLDVG